MSEAQFITWGLAVFGIGALAGSGAILLFDRRAESKLIIELQARLRTSEYVRGLLRRALRERSIGWMANVIEREMRF